MPLRSLRRQTLLDTDPAKFALAVIAWSMKKGAARPEPTDLRSCPEVDWVRSIMIYYDLLKNFLSAALDEQQSIQQQNTLVTRQIRNWETRRIQKPKGSFRIQL